MHPHEDRLFQSWCRRGDAEALGELFDLVAPRLFKLAVHLVGDAAAAEDLVQACFLALIEQRSTIDATRPAQPWLNGVLTHKAQQLRRERAKSIDIERLEQRAVADPSARLEQRELSGELAEAIDKLGEPYRQVLLLRVRHGMELGDIAHVLERDPGTVSVQLHRGIERLRQLLPRALIASLLVGLFSPRGLAAVKASVMDAAAATTALAGGVSILGGLLVWKKIVALACVILLAVFLYTEWPREDLAATESDQKIGENVAHLEVPALAVPAVVGARTLEAAREPSALRFTARVIDAESGAGLARADVAMFRGRETMSFELQRDHSEYYLRSMGGRLTSRTRGDWPRIVDADELALSNHKPLLSLDRPDADQKPIARTTTDENGEFTLAGISGSGLIEVSLAGHATRWRPFVDGKLPSEISLWHEREVTGQLIDQSGAKISEPIEIVLLAAGEPSKAALARYEHDRLVAFRDSGDRTLDREGLECRRLTTASDGSFRARFAANLTPDFGVLSTGWQRMGQEPQEAGSDSFIGIIARVSVLHFFDAQSGEPIERVHILVRDMANGYVVSSGEILAPGGLARIPVGSIRVGNGSHGLTAWAIGYAPAHWTSSWQARAGQIEIPVQPGASAALEGRVMRGERPLDGALVAILGHSSVSWSPEPRDYTPLLDATTTRAGAFHFELPPGKYVLQVREGVSEVYRVVEAPTLAPLIVDLDQIGAINVEVVDQAKTPRKSHVVALRGKDGRTVGGSTNDSGVVLFDSLPAGEYSLYTPNVSGSSYFSGEANKIVELAEGRRIDVRLETIASTTPRHARIVAKGTADYSAWRARYNYSAWSEIGADGTIPMELSQDEWELEISAPDGRAWSLAIPKTAPDGYVIELEAGDARLEGEVVDSEGRPMTGVKVTAQPRSIESSKRVNVCATSDESGRFALGGLCAGACELKFERHQGELKSLTFRPNAPASSTPEWLRIELSTPMESVLLSGTVRDRSGKARGGLMLFATASMPQTQGILRLTSSNYFTRTDNEGHYQLSVARTPTIRLAVEPPDGGKPLAEHELADDGSPARTVDFTID